MARVLVAEDDPSIFRLVSFGLKQRGHEVFWAQDGGEAVALARSRDPQLVLLDIMMPVLDGLQVLKILKSDPLTQAIRVIIVTASGRAQDIATCMDAGAYDYIVKPFSFTELLGRATAAIEAP